MLRNRVLCCPEGEQRINSKAGDPSGYRDVSQKYGHFPHMICLFLSFTLHT